MALGGGPHRVVYLSRRRSTALHDAGDIQQRSPLYGHVKGVAAQLSSEFRQDHFDPMRRLITVGDNILSGGAASTKILVGIILQRLIAAIGMNTCHRRVLDSQPR